VRRDAKGSQIGNVASVAKETVAAHFARVGDGIVSAAQYDILASRGFQKCNLINKDISMTSPSTNTSYIKMRVNIYLRAACSKTSWMVLFSMS